MWDAPHDRGQLGPDRAAARAVWRRPWQHDAMTYIRGNRVVRLLCARCEQGLAIVHRSSEGVVTVTDWENRIIAIDDEHDEQHAGQLVVRCRDDEHGDRTISTERVVKATHRAMQRNRAILLRL